MIVTLLALLPIGILALNVDDILTKHEQWSNTSTKHFSGETLAYVTPWNAHGYDAAKWFRSKFTFIAPVWINIHRTGPFKYDLVGTHDIDTDWMAHVRDSDPKPKLTPRFQFDRFKQEDYLALLSSSSHGTHREFESLSSSILSVCQKYHFDGIVLEVGSPQYFYSLVEFLATSLHAHNLLLILVVPPSSRMSSPSQKSSDHSAASFTFRDFLDFSRFVDRFSFMTYDYANSYVPGPNAPIAWVEKEVHMVCQMTEMCFKVLMGINFYGNDYYGTKGEGGAITGSRYIEVRTKYELLRRYRPELVWNEEDEEHVFKYVDEKRQEHTVYYPTIDSLRARFKLAEKLKVGISIWEIGQGLDYFSVMDDEEKRSDEQLALTSILPHFSIIDPLRYKLLIPYAASPRSADDQTDAFIHVDIRIPTDYPSSSPPLITYHPLVPWLNSMEVTRKVNEYYEVACGEVMLFEWCEWMREYVSTQMEESKSKHESVKAKHDNGVEGKEEGVEERVEFDVRVSKERLVDRKSVFVGYLTRITSSSEARQFHGLIKRQHPNATHAIMAYRVVVVERHNSDRESRQRVEQDYDDDGEAQAGHRVLALLERSGSENVVVVVVRWFGGIKLGSDRFRLINRCAKQLLKQEGYIHTID